MLKKKFDTRMKIFSSLEAYKFCQPFPSFKHLRRQQKYMRNLSKIAPSTAAT